MRLIELSGPDAAETHAAWARRWSRIKRAARAIRLVFSPAYRRRRSGRDAGLMGYTLGLHDVGHGCWAYLQPDGGWGWSNAGLIDGDGVSLLVDTLFDVPLTRAMLDSMGGVTARSPIGTAVNTHANGDHCYGNSELAAGVEIVATAAAAHEMTEVPPATLAAMSITRRRHALRGFQGDRSRDADS